MFLICDFSGKLQCFVVASSVKHSPLALKLVNPYFLRSSSPLFQIFRDYLPGTALGIALVQGSTGARSGIAPGRAETYDDGALVRLRWSIVVEQIGIVRYGTICKVVGEQRLPL